VKDVLMRVGGAGFLLFARAPEQSRRRSKQSASRREARPVMGAVDGEWKVHRTGGLLPPLLGVRKRIRDDQGWTALGPLPGAPFDIVGTTLRYRGPFSGFVDHLERDGPDRYRGRATFRGREFGRFVMERMR
jgi:hypothetical protein